MYISVLLYETLGLKSGEFGENVRPTRAGGYVQSVKYLSHAWCSSVKYVANFTPGVMPSVQLIAGFEQMCAQLESFPKVGGVGGALYQVGPCIDGLNRIDLSYPDEQAVAVDLRMPQQVYQAFEAVAPVTVLDGHEVEVDVSSLLPGAGAPCVIRGSRLTFAPISMGGSSIVLLALSLSEQDFASGASLALVNAFVGVARA